MTRTLMTGPRIPSDLITKLAIIIYHLAINELISTLSEMFADLSQKSIIALVLVTRSLQALVLFVHKIIFIDDRLHAMSELQLLIIMILNNSFDFVSPNE